MPAAAVVSTQDHFPGKTNDNGTRISRDAFAKKKKKNVLILKAEWHASVRPIPERRKRKRASALKQMSNGEKCRKQGKCYPGPMRGMSWCSDSVERYLFSSSTRCLCVFAPPSRFSRSSSCEAFMLAFVLLVPWSGADRVFS